MRFPTAARQGFPAISKLCPTWSGVMPGSAVGVTKSPKQKSMLFRHNMIFCQKKNDRRSADRLSGVFGSAVSCARRHLRLGKEPCIGRDRHPPDLGTTSVAPRLDQHGLTLGRLASDRFELVPLEEKPPGHLNFACGWTRRGYVPIGVKLAPKGIADMGPSLSSGVRESAMDVSVGEKEVVEADSASDRIEQKTQGGVPHAPERRQVGCVEHLLRGKIPGTPG